MSNPKTKLIIYVTISACIILAVWLATIRHTIRHEFNGKEKDSLFNDIKISLSQAWAELPELSAPTTTDLQGGPKLTKNQFDDLIDKLDITVPTSTPTTTDLEVETSIDTSDWLTYRNEEYGFELKYPKTYYEHKIIDDNFTTYGKIISNKEGDVYDVVDDGIWIHIKKIDNTQNLTLEQLATNNVSGSSLYLNRQVIKIYNTQAIKQVETDDPEGPGGSAYYSEAVYIANNNHVCKISGLSLNKGVFSHYKQVYNNIISTFKFTQ